MYKLTLKEKEKLEKLFERGHKYIARDEYWDGYTELWAYGEEPIKYENNIWSGDGPTTELDSNLFEFINSDKAYEIEKLLQEGVVE